MKDLDKHVVFSRCGLGICLTENGRIGVMGSTISIEIKSRSYLEGHAEQVLV